MKEEPTTKDVVQALERAYLLIDSFRAACADSGRPNVVYATQVMKRQLADLSHMTESWGFLEGLENEHEKDTTKAQDPAQAE